MAAAWGTRPWKNLVLHSFMAIDKARLRRAVRPGDIIYYRVEKIRNRGRVWRYRGQAVVNGLVVAQAEFSAAIVELQHWKHQK